MTSEEEMRKRAERAKRYGVEDKTAVTSRLVQKTEEELEEMRKRSERFGIPVKPTHDVMTNVLSQIRDQTDHMDATIRADALQFYSGAERGLHPIGTATILKQFKDYGVAWVEWLGAKSTSHDVRAFRRTYHERTSPHRPTPRTSGCNVVFNDDTCAARVFKTLAAPVPLDSASEEEKKLLSFWRAPLEPLVKVKSDDYGDKGAVVHFLVRYATDASSDRKKPKTREERRRHGQNGKRRPRVRHGKAQRRHRGGRRHNPYGDNSNDRRPHRRSRAQERRRNDSSPGFTSTRDVVNNLPGNRAEPIEKREKLSFEERMGGALSSSR